MIRIHRAERNICRVKNDVRGNPSGCIVITSYNIKNDLEKILKPI